MSTVQVPKAEDLCKGDKPVFDNSKVTVVFVLGGPGAGKFGMEFWVGRRETSSGTGLCTCNTCTTTDYPIWPFQPDHGAVPARGIVERERVDGVRERALT